MKNKKVSCWDLEGPISVLDFAAEIGRLLGVKSELNLQKYDMGDFFFMISEYDDYLIDTPGIKEQLNIPEYQPGDTLRIMAPMYVTAFSDKELIHLAKNNLGLLPGIKELMALLREEWDIYVISTSYSQFAHQVTESLNIAKDHVYCTNLPISELKNNSSNIIEEVKYLVNDVFKQYLNNHKKLDSILLYLNDFFWGETSNDYIEIMNQIKVRGGKRKERAIEEIQNITGIPLSKMIAIGDSITDINMLERVNKEGGIAISFNGNRFSLRKANLAITSPNGLGSLPIFESYGNVWKFVQKWELEFEKFRNNPRKIANGLVSERCRNYFLRYNFVPQISNLRNIDEDVLQNIIFNQEAMRKKVRGWAGDLG